MKIEAEFKDFGVLMIVVVMNKFELFMDLENIAVNLTLRYDNSLQSKI